MRDWRCCGSRGLPRGVDVAKCSLLGVAFLWGTYSVALRLIYADNGADDNTCELLISVAGVDADCASGPPVHASAIWTSARAAGRR